MVWVVWSLVACSGTGGVPPIADPVLGAEELACATDGDCVAVELGCCNHCNSGKVIAVARTHAAAVKETWRQQPCDISCTQRSCPPAGVRCTAGTCELVQR